MSEVKCERFEEAAKPKPQVGWPWYAVGVVLCVSMFWIYNHIVGGCFDTEDLLTYCEYRPPTISPTK